jgi:predicted RNA-binding protein YlqC (UPF0109 family)
VYVTTQAIETMVKESPAGKMVQLVTDVAKSLVDTPDSVAVEAIPDGEGTVLRLRVAASDLGKIIGRQGRTARSLRTILGAASMKVKHRFSLDIIEEP